MVVSQGYAGIIDPHRKCCPTAATAAGTRMKLKGFLEKRDHAACFEGIFGLSAATTHYQNTLFRFPLRHSKSASKISHNVYDTKKVAENLFSSFKAEAKVILLFLRNVKKVGLYEWNEIVSKPAFLYSIGVDEEICTRCSSLLSEQREQCHSAANEYPTSYGSTMCSFTVTFKESSAGDHESSPPQHWLVSSLIGTSNPELRELATELIVLPWVAVAAPLPSHTCLKHACVTHMKEDVVKSPEEFVRLALVSFKDAICSTKQIPLCAQPESIQGQAFCFLPLPGTTALPVHIHGYFAVADNRRSIKWPAHDEKGRQAEWNQKLMNSMVAPVYASLIACKNQLFHCPDIFSLDRANQVLSPHQSWPIYSEVKHLPIWLSLVEPTLRLTCSTPSFWTAAKGGRWVTLQDALFTPMVTTCPDIAVELLIKAGINVVILPESVHYTLKSIGLGGILEAQTVTPKQLREVIKGGLHTELHGKKLYDTLEYVLSDLSGSHYREMIGVPLLPLQNRSNSRFEKPSKSNSKYLFPRELKEVLQFIPGIEADVIDTSLPNTIFQMLESMVKSKCVQVQLVTSHVVCTTLLPKSIKLWCKKTDKPFQWQWTPGRKGPPVSWMRKVWDWLCKNGNLDTLKHLPLVPQKCLITLERVEHSAVINLYELDESARLCLACDESPSFIPVLEKLDFIIIEHSDCVFQHHGVKNYVPAITPELILMKGNTVAVYMMRDNHKTMLREYLARKFRTVIPKHCKQVLLTIPIFEAGIGSGTSRFVALNQQENFIVPPARCHLPSELVYPDNILNSDDPFTVELLGKLGFKPKKVSDFQMKYLLSFAHEQCRSGNPLSRNNGDELIKWILKDGDRTVIDFLKNAQIIRCKDNPLILKRPVELFDPDDTDFNETMFCSSDSALPDSKYPRKHLPGLKTWKAMKLNPKELCRFIVDRAFSISHLAAMKPLIALKRSQFILKVILEDRHSKQLMQAVRDIPFLFPELHSPTCYPDGLQWFASSSCSTGELLNMKSICVPRSAERSTLALTVGGTASLISSDYDSILPQYHFNFECFYQPKVSDIVGQLHLLVDVVQSKISAAGTLVVIGKGSEFYGLAAQKIYTYLSMTKYLTQLEPSSLPSAWIWWPGEKGGGKFLLPSMVFQYALPHVASFEPYCYCISSNSELSSHHLKLFNHCGIRNQPEPQDLVYILEQMQTESGCLSSHQLNIVMAILREIKNEESKLGCSKSDIPFPTTNNRLLHAKYCTYDDRQIAERHKSKGTVSRFTFVHKCVSHDLAQQFSIEPLSLSLAPSFKIKFTLKGQHERITQRIKHVVQDYAANIDVFKELIQNADDAKATEVRFLIDWRSHPSSSTITNELAAWQGPALIAYNNAVFTDDDLEHICHVAGETKKDDPLKIGRFGVGFCAVYRLTDLPTFISRRYFTMFDPHTAYLGERVSSSEPGMRIDLVENKMDLMVYEDQFAPYDGVFCCNVFDLNEEGYNGTIFRFPFRNVETAKRSEISPFQCTEGQIDSLRKEFEKEATRILTFLKHVQKLSLYTLHRTAKKPSEMNLVFHIESVRDDPYRRVQLIADYSSHPGRPMHNKSMQTITAKVKSRTLSAEKWLIVSALGAGHSHDFIQKHNSIGLVPFAEIAVRLVSEREVYMPEQVKGRMYCFLPLPLHNGLKFDINGFFDIGKDRRHLTATDDRSFGSQWNEALGGDALVDAFVNLLVSLAAAMPSHLNAELKKRYLTNYYALWDFSSAKGIVPTAMAALLKKKLTETDEKVLWSELHGGKWLSPKEAVVFRDWKVKKGTDICNSTIELMLANDLPLVNVQSSIEKLLELKKYTYRKFCEEVFIPTIMYTSDKLQHIHLLFLLEMVDTEPNENLWAKELLQKNSCIPCVNSTRLQPPNNLIDCSQSFLKNLYAYSEGRFPSSILQESEKAMRGLRSVGMSSYKLSTSDLLDRARTVRNIAESDQQAAKERSCHFLEYIDYVYNNRSHLYIKDMKVLLNIDFLPVLASPEGCCLCWHNSPPYTSPTTCYSPMYCQLVFTQCPVLDIPDGIPTGISDICGVKKVPKSDVILAHFQCLINHLSGQDEIDDKTAAYLDEKNVISAIYAHFNNVRLFKKQYFNETLKPSIHGKQFIFQGHQLICSHQVVLESWKHNYYPYMCQLSAENRKFIELFSELGVQSQLTVECLIEILALVSRDFQGHPLSDELLQFVVYVSSELKRAIISGKPYKEATIFLPDESKIMYPTSKLASDKEVAEWVERMGLEASVLYIHKDIPRDTAISLGAKPLLDTVVKGFEESNFMEGMDFGQEEELCTRLQSILKKYPPDCSIFHEFIQNADDAGASEVVFVLDNRTNFPQEKLLSQDKKWKLLQATPALCIYNNQKFTERDIEGISKLGRGAKDNSPELIGKFGIGFNVAYHLSDCPSFVSFDEKGTPEDLCVFDPTYSFVPKARHKQKPGRRWKLDFKIAKDLPDQFQPYLDLLKECTSGSTEDNGHVVFRLPLTRQKLVQISSPDVSQYPTRMTSYMHRYTSAMVPEMKLGYKAFDPQNVRELFREFKAKSRSSLLFLNHIRQVRVFEILEDGKCKHHFTTSIRIPLIYQERCLQFSLDTKQWLMSLRANMVSDSLSCFHEAESILTQTNTCDDQHSEEEKTTWLVQRLLGIPSCNQDDNSVILDAMRYNLTPVGGVAAQLCKACPPRDKTQHTTFCFLPTPIYNPLPVHVNGHFLIDDSRKHFEKIYHEKCLKLWNHTLATKVIVQAYTMLILEARKYSEDVSVGLDWFYNLFPQSISVSRQLGPLEIVEAFYELLLSKKQPVFALQISTSISWLCPDECLFCVNFMSEITNRKVVVEPKLRAALLSLGMPITNAPDSVYNCMIQVQPEFTQKGRVETAKIVSHLNCIDYSSGSYYTVMKENIVDLLLLILTECKPKDVRKVLQKVPLLHAKDKSFQRTNQIYESRHADLLPHDANIFVDCEFESSVVGKALLKESFNVIIPLSLSHVAQSIQIDDENKAVHFSTCSPQHQSLLKHLWRLLAECSSVQQRSVLQFIEKIPWKPVIPASDGSIYPASLSKTVLCARPVDDVTVWKALIKLGYAVVKFSTIGLKEDESTYSISQVLVNPGSANDIVQCLQLQKPPNVAAEFTQDEVCEFIHIIRNCNIEPIVTTLRSMRLFQTIGDRYIPLHTARKVIVLPLEVPLDGILDITPITDYDILKACDPTTSKFYADVIPNFQTDVTVSPAIFYIKIVLPNIHKMSSTAVQKHVTYIFQNSEECEYECVMRELAEVELVTNSDGITCPISSFYNPDDPFFQTFHTNHLLPTEWLKLKPGWRPFLKKLGFHDEITLDDWLFEAKSFADTVCMRVADFRTLAIKSEILMLSLMNFSFFKGKPAFASQRQAVLDFLKEVSQITFITPSSAEIKLLINRLFSAQTVDTPGQLISFRGAVLSRDANLAGLCSPALPQCCDKFVHIDVTIIRALGVEIPVSPDTVCHNLIELSKAATSSCSQLSSPSLMKPKQRLKAVLMEHYERLNSCKATKNCLFPLQGKQCLLLDDPEIYGVINLVEPSQLLKRLPPGYDLRPLCYKVPRHLQKFDHLLEELGVDDELTSTKCASILREICKELKDKKLTSEGQYLKVAEFAYTEFIHCLRRESNPDPLSEVYLLSRGNELVKSTEVYYDDVPWLTSRLSNSKKYKFLKDTPKDNCDERSLPPALNIPPISSVISETLHEEVLHPELKCTDEELFEEKRTNYRCKVVEMLLVTLNSDEFLYGLSRIYHHEHKQAPPEDFHKNAAKFRLVQVKCIRGKLKTRLVEDGHTISGTEEQGILCHLVQDNENKNNILYISPHSDDFETEHQKFLKELSASIAKILHGTITNTSLIADIFECDPAKISTVLTKSHVSPYNPSSLPTTHQHKIGDNVCMDQLFHEDLLIIIDYVPEEIVLYCSGYQNTLEYAEVVECCTPDNVYDKSVKIKALVHCTSEDDDDSECVLTYKVSPLQVFKIFTTSQRKALMSTQSSKFATPLSMMEAPSNSSEIEVWLEEILQSRLIQSLSSYSVQLIILRLVKHIHYQLITQGRASGHVFTKAMSSLQDLVNAVPLPAIPMKSDLSSSITKLMEHLTLAGNNTTDSDDENESTITHAIFTDEQRQSVQYPSASEECDQQALAAPGTLHLRITGPSTPAPVHAHQSGTSASALPIPSLPQTRRFVQTRRGHRSISTHVPQSRFLHHVAPTEPPRPQTCTRSAQMWFDQAKADYKAACSLVSLPQSLSEEETDEDARSVLSLGTSSYSSTENIPEAENSEELLTSHVAKLATAEERGSSTTPLSSSNSDSEADEEMEFHPTNDIACQFPALVCFLCHDTIEKCLKAVSYAFCGLRQDLMNSSHLVTLINHLKQSSHCPQDLKDPMEECVMSVNMHENKSRYPNFQIPPCAPVAVYQPSDAQETLTAVEKLLKVLCGNIVLEPLIGEIHLLSKPVCETAFEVAGGGIGGMNVVFHKQL